MSDGAVSRLWQRIRQQFDAEAGHLHRLFFPEDGAVQMIPNDSYVRIWLSEPYLANQVSWGWTVLPPCRLRCGCCSGGSVRKRSLPSSSLRLGPGTGYSRTTS